MKHVPATPAPSARVVIIIPARFQSSRYPGKPLAMLRGASGVAKSLIQRSWECATSVPGVHSVWVATDDTRIAEAVTAFGGQVVMTSPDCLNGTERCADAVSRLGDVADIIVNVQGDAPLTPVFVVEHLVEALRSNPDIMMTTPAVRCSPSVLDHLLTDQANGRVGGTTVVFNARGRAHYFSKRVLPHFVPQASGGDIPVHLHLGVYAYRPDALSTYASLPPSSLELLEGLEQLRFLEAECPVSVVQFDPPEWDSIELNNPEDVPLIEAILTARGIP